MFTITFNCSIFSTVSLIGRHGDKIFDQREVSFNLGDGLEHNIPDGVEQALLKFKKNERSILQLKPDYGFGSAGSQELTIPANASLEYEVELKNFEKAKESWSMDADEKLEQAKLCKEKGTTHFKSGKYALAIKQYAKIVSYLEFEKSKSETKQQFLRHDNCNWIIQPSRMKSWWNVMPYCWLPFWTRQCVAWNWTSSTSPKTTARKLSTWILITKKDCSVWARYFSATNSTTASH